MHNKRGPFAELVKLVRNDMGDPKAAKPLPVALILRVEPGRVEMHVEAKGEQVQGTSKMCATDAVIYQSLDELAQGILSGLAQLGLRREAVRPKRRGKQL